MTNPAKSHAASQSVKATGSMENTIEHLPASDAPKAIGAKTEASTARRMVSGVRSFDVATPNDLHHDIFGCVNPSPFALAIRVGSKSRSLTNTFTGDNYFRRLSAGVRTVGKAMEARVRLRFAGRYFHHYVASAGRISGGRNRSLNAGGRRGAGKLRVTKASSVLAALAKRMPSVAHRKRDAEIADIALDEVASMTHW